MYCDGSRVWKLGGAAKGGLMCSTIFLNVLPNLLGLGGGGRGGGRTSCDVSGVKLLLFRVSTG